MIDPKQNILDILIKHQEDKILFAQNELNALKESRDRDTKSSAGDKHETGRAMMQMEVDKAEQQLSRLQQQLGDVKSLPWEKTHTVAGPGSLVTTDAGIYFIGVALGKLEIEGVTVFAVSGASPIGKILCGKQVGHVLDFQGRHVKIESVT